MPADTPDDPIPPPHNPTARPSKQGRLRPLLLRRAGAAALCQVGVSTWDRLTAAGQNPTPVRMGGSVLWSRRELAAWVDHACPPRIEWGPIWAALRAARRRTR